MSEKPALYRCELLSFLDEWLGDDALIKNRDVRRPFAPYAAEKNSDLVLPFTIRADSAGRSIIGSYLMVISNIQCSDARDRFSSTVRGRRENLRRACFYALRAWSEPSLLSLDTSA
jgi:hypothetical protein